MFVTCGVCRVFFLSFLKVGTVGIAYSRINLKLCRQIVSAWLYHGSIVNCSFIPVHVCWGRNFHGHFLVQEPSDVPRKEKIQFVLLQMIEHLLKHGYCPRNKFLSQARVVPHEIVFLLMYYFMQALKCSFALWKD